MKDYSYTDSTVGELLEEINLHYPLLWGEIADLETYDERIFRLTDGYYGFSYAEAQRLLDHYNA